MNIQRYEVKPFVDSELWYIADRAYPKDQPARLFEDRTIACHLADRLNFRANW